MRRFWEYRNSSLFTQDLQWLVGEAVRKNVRDHGPDPATRLQAAAHEAGHVVVATVLGESVTGARIFSREGRWLGANRRGTIAKSPTFLVEDPLSSFAAICNNLAGFGGEILSNSHHLSSSLDERMRAEQIITGLSGCIGMPQDQLKILSALLIKKAIESHLSAFSVVRKHLYAKRRLLQTDARRMLSPVKSIPVFLSMDEARRCPDVFIPMILSYLEGR